MGKVRMDMGELVSALENIAERSKYDEDTEVLYEAAIILNQCRLVMERAKDGMFIRALPTPNGFKLISFPCNVDDIRIDVI